MYVIIVNMLYICTLYDYLFENVPAGLPQNPHEDVFP